MRAATARGLAAILALVSAPAWAADPTLPAELAAGGASRADPDSLTAVATSPAMIAMSRRYSLDLAGRFGSEREQTWQAAVSDSMTGPVAMGVLFSYNRTIPEVASAGELPGWKLPDEQLESKRMRMSVGGALAGAWLDEVVGLGVNVFYHRTASSYVEADNAVDVGASLSVMLAPDLYLSAVAENVVPHQTFTDAPFRVGGGLRWAPERRSGIGLDLMGDLDAAGGPALIVNTGGSIYVAERLWLAGGFESDGTLARNRATAGIGAGTDKAVLRYTFAAPVGSPDGFSSQHAIGLRIDF